jgi:phosphatidylglycerophosphate synthase
MTAGHAETGVDRSQPAHSGRPPEMEDWLNRRIYHPLSHRLALLLSGTRVTPNAVSVAGGLAIVAAGLLYTGLRWPEAALLGFLVHASWHVLDGADGDLARMTGRTSPIGEFVDGVCDYAGHVILYTILAFLFLDQTFVGSWAYWIVASAGASRVLQASRSESQRRTYLWRAFGVPWIKQSVSAGDGLARPEPLMRLSALITRLYLAVSGATSERVERVNALALEPAGREAVRRESRLSLRLHTLMGANARTVALGLSMAAGSPLWYFVGEIVLGNLLLLVAAAAQRRCDERLERLLGAEAGG